MIPEVAPRVISQQEHDEVRQMCSAVLARHINPPSYADVLERVCIREPDDDRFFVIEANQRVRLFLRCEDDKEQTYFSAYVNDDTQTDAAMDHLLAQAASLGVD